VCPDWADLVLVLFPFFFDRSQRGRSCCEIDSHGPRAFLGVHDEITRSQGSNGQCSNRVTHENGCYPISDTTYFNRIKLVALRMCASLCSTKKKDQVCFRIPILCGMATNASSSQVKTLQDSFRQGTVCKNVMCICVCSAFNSNRLCAENNHNLLRRTVPTASSRQLNDMIPRMTCRDVVF